jgi:hypothetical protein
LWFLFLFEISGNNERLCVCAALYREVGEASKETEHSEAISKKVKDLKRHIEEAEAASSHHQLLQVTLILTVITIARLSPRNELIFNPISKC